MKFTIAIPTFNNERSIGKAIESAVFQQYEGEYEILIVNNASTDNTLGVIQRYINDARVRIVLNDETVSLFENHNVCLREAVGDYVLFCHSDDELLPDALQKFDLALSRYGNPNKIVCFGRSFFRDFHAAFSKGGTLNSISSGLCAQAIFQHGLTPSGTCFGRSSFLLDGGFLPMKSKATPCDMSSLLRYSVSGAEFLMIDRVVFFRKFASTLESFSDDYIYSLKCEALDVLMESKGNEFMVNLYKNLKFLDGVTLEQINALSRYKKDIAYKTWLKCRFVFFNPSYLLKMFFRLHNFKMLFVL